MLAEAITPSISLMWPGEASAQEAADQAVKDCCKVVCSKK